MLFYRIVVVFLFLFILNIVISSILYAKDNIKVSNVFFYIGLLIGFFLIGYGIFAISYGIGVL